MFTFPIDSAATRGYAVCLLRIHALIIAGLADGPGHDAITDAMDPLWEAMTAHQRLAMRKLSADLYALTEPLLERTDASVPQ